MLSLDIAATEVTPRVWFDPASSCLTIEGESYPENVSEFYDSVFAWLNQALTDLTELKVNFYYAYLNTSSTKAVLDLLQTLDDVHRSGSAKVNVLWRYRAQIEVMRETGEELGEDFDLPFELEAVK